jgi:uncharacterized membrane protein YfcA
MELPVVVLIIALFSIIQSIFGVGLLVFGTPTFLLLGVSYAETVGYLLPSSLLLSALQAHGFKNKIRIARGIVIYAMPFVFFGMLLSVDSKHDSIITIVGIIMLASSLIRIVDTEKISEKIKKFGRTSLIITGVIHGVSNQGGALLAILMGSLYNDKEKIRTNIAFAYFLFGLSQFAVLLWLKVGSVSLISIVYVFVTLMVYQLVGKTLFKFIDVSLFNMIFTGFIAIYGMLLLLPSVG